MKQALMVGTGAALPALFLISLTTYVELRFTGLGMFMRDIAEHGAPGKGYGNPIEFMNRWLRIDPFVVAPALSFLLGLLVGCFSRRRVFLSLLLALTPVLFLDCRGWELWSILAGGMSLLSGWAGVKAAGIRRAIRADFADDQRSSTNDLMPVGGN